MNGDQINTTPSKQRLRLPKPDMANITVLTPNLPNKPILPWNHFDSPWLSREIKKPEQILPAKSSVTFMLLIIYALIALLIEALATQSSHQPVEERQPNQTG